MTMYMTKKKAFFISVAVLAASAFLTGCSSDLSEVVEPQQAQLPVVTYVVNVSASMNDGGLTRALATAGSGASEELKPSWTDETVYVYSGETKVGTLTPSNTNAEGTSTTLTGLLEKEGGFAKNETLRLYYLKDKPDHGDYSGQKGTIEDISANYDYATATITVEEVAPTEIFGNDNILKTSHAAFTKSQAVVKLMLGFKGEALNVSSLTISSDNLQGGPLTIAPTSAKSTLYFALHNNSTGTQSYTIDAVAGGQDYSYTFNREFADATFTNPNMLMPLVKSASHLTIEAIADQTYANADITPEPVVKDGATILVKGTDYESTISYSNNRNVGTATVTVTGKGNYSGTKSQTFKIVKATPTITVGTGVENALIDLRTDTKTLNIGASADLGATIDGDAYASSNPAVATVNSSGVITGVSGGSTTITVKTVGTDNLNVQTKTFTVYVKEGIGGGLSAPGLAGVW